LFGGNGSAEWSCVLHRAAATQALVHVALIERDALVEQAEADQTAVIAEAGLAGLGGGNNLACSGLCGRSANER